MKKILLLVLVTAAILFIFQPVTVAENIYSFIDSGTDYSSDKPADEGDSLQLYDNATGITAEINHQVLDQGAFNTLRDYYNDDSLTEQELFNRLVELKKSYIDALQALYNTNYMNPDKKSTETAMRIYFNGAETLYGLTNCSVYLYNIVQYEGLSSSELVHLDMIIPDRPGNTIITIKFTIPKENLGALAIETIESMMSGFHFAGLPSQTEAPLVTKDKDIMSKVKLGVYPAESQSDPETSSFINSTAGYSVSLPTSYVPYIQNNLGGVFTYTSFKINPNIILSISSEPLQSSGMSDALMRFKVTAYGSVNMLENSSRKFGGKEYSILSYISSTDGQKQYYKDFYTQFGTRLFKLQLQSAIAEPGKIVMDQMTAILASFDSSASKTPESPIPSADSVYSATDSVNPSSDSVNSSTVKYMNNEEGYSFSYPKNWRLEDVSDNIAFDRLRLVIPGLSGALDVSVQESELKQIVTFSDIVKSINGKSVTSWPNLAVNYAPPFEGKISKLLYSDFTINGPVSVIYRQSVFMDDNGRNRLCYSVDIINGRKLYSMFITAAEYKTADGFFSDLTINELINTIAASFHLEKTPESEARRIEGEIRNRKLVLVEKYLKQVIDPQLTITAVDKLQPDGTFYATVGNTGESGFYKMRLDYQDKQVAIMDHTLLRNILGVELEKLKTLYSGKTIVQAVQNESNMTMTITTRDNPQSDNIVRTYKVNAFTAGDKVEWHTVRLAHQEDYIWECDNYIKSLLSPDTKVYYQASNVFTDMSAYEKNRVPYRLMTYVISSSVSGFLVLEMDPQSSIFSLQSGLIQLDTVVKSIKTTYGIKYLSRKPDAISFNPETFVLTLRTADRQGNDTLIEKYKLIYNLEKGILDYKNLN